MGEVGGIGRGGVGFFRLPRLDDLQKDICTKGDLAAGAEIYPLILDQLIYISLW